MIGRTKIIIGSSVGLLVVAGGATYYIVHAVKREDNNISFDINEINDKAHDDKVLDSIFPKIKQEDYYDKIRIKDANPFIDEDFLAYVAKDIIEHIQIPDGKINWGFSINESGSTGKLKFVWASDSGRSYTRGYEFTVTKDV